MTINIGSHVILFSDQYGYVGGYLDPAYPTATGTSALRFTGLNASSDNALVFRIDEMRGTANGTPVENSPFDSGANKNGTIALAVQLGTDEVTDMHWIKRAASALDSHLSLERYKTSSQYADAIKLALENITSPSSGTVDTGEEVYLRGDGGSKTHYLSVSVSQQASLTPAVKYESHTNKNYARVPLRIVAVSGKQCSNGYVCTYSVACQAATESTVCVNKQACNLTTQKCENCVPANNRASSKAACCSHASQYYQEICLVCLPDGAPSSDATACCNQDMKEGACHCTETGPPLSGNLAHCCTQAMDPDGNCIDCVIEEECSTSSQCCTGYQCIKLPENLVKTCEFVQRSENGAECKNDSECLSGYCDREAGTPYHCAVRPQPSNCTVDGNCTQDYWCDDGSCTAPRVEGGDCTRPAQCLSGVCITGKCSNKRNGVNDPCNDEDDCLTGYCDQGKCALIPDGAACTDDAHCASGDCGTTVFVSQRTRTHCLSSSLLLSVASYFLLCLSWCWYSVGTLAKLRRASLAR